MDAASVIGLVNPQGGSVKRSDYALQDNDYVIREGDTPNTIASAMKVNEKTISDLGSYQTCDVIPGMPSEQSEVSMEEAHRVKSSDVTKDPAILNRMKEMGVPDPSKLSAEDYLTAQMLVFNDMLSQEKEVMGEGYSENDAIKGLADRHPKQMTAMFKNFSRIVDAEKSARDYEGSKAGSTVTGSMMNMGADIVGEQPPLGGMYTNMTTQMRKEGM